MRRVMGSPEARGQAAVELALVLPILLLVGLALVQVGLLARDRLVLEQASRAGAREAAVTPDEEAVRRAVVAAAPGLDLGAIELEVARAGSAGDPVTVSLRYADPVRVPFVGWLFPPAVELSASATARQEFA
ncbi:MAG TPA: TadE/TadG family type IV pilus assembly protein [Actinomycetota bacterium]|nr:TadE/TadG family type IV pilus assembly protein [Actinomycetota bacterium]